MSILSGSVLQRHETVRNLVHHYIHKSRFFTFLEYAKPLGCHALSELQLWRLKVSQCLHLQYQTVPEEFFTFHFQKRGQ